MIIIYFVGVKQFGKVQVDSHGNGYDWRQKDENTSELNGDIGPLCFLKEQHDNSDDHHDEE